MGHFMERSNIESRVFSKRGPADSIPASYKTIHMPDHIATRQRVCLLFFQVGNAAGERSAGKCERFKS